MITFFFASVFEISAATSRAFSDAFLDPMIAALGLGIGI